MRTFVAIDIGAEVRQRLAVAMQAQRAAAPYAKWIAEEAIHLTLVFLGEVEVEASTKMGTALADVAGRHARLTLNARGSGSFGRGARPHVLWIGLDGDLAALAALQADLAAALTPLGHEPEGRPFQPHLTLARSRGTRGDPALARCAQALATIDLGVIAVEEVVLYRSDLLRDGARHTALSSARLGGETR